MSCLTNRALVATEGGEVSADRLAPGDRVITRDSGLQRVLRVRRVTLAYGDLAARAHLQPLLVRQGAFGPDLPETDLMVSPNQRFLVTRDRTALYLDSPEAMVATKHLLDHGAVQRVTSIGTTFVHVELARTESILANGAWCEALQPAQARRLRLANAQRTELRELFPEGPESALDAPIVEQSAASDMVLLGN